MNEDGHSYYIEVDFFFHHGNNRNEPLKATQQKMVTLNGYR